MPCSPPRRSCKYADVRLHASSAPTAATLYKRHQPVRTLPAPQAPHPAVSTLNPHPWTLLQAFDVDNKYGLEAMKRMFTDLTGATAPMPGVVPPEVDLPDGYLERCPVANRPRAKYEYFRETMLVRGGARAGCVYGDVGWIAARQVTQAASLHGSDTAHARHQLSLIKACARSWMPAPYT
jgi:hypothetical protein